MYPAWALDFSAFNTWISDNLGPKPEGCSLDRIDNEGHYEPGNLRWATPEVQNNNTRANVYLEYAGVRLTLAQWAKKQGLSTGTLWARLNLYSWPVAEALTTPVRKPRNV